MSRWNEPDERDDSTGKLPDGETSYLSLLSKDTKLQVLGFVHLERYFAEKSAPDDLWAFDSATGTFTIKRLDFKIGEGEWADTSMVANDVQVKFKLAVTGVAPL